MFSFLPAPSFLPCLFILLLLLLLFQGPLVVSLPPRNVTSFLLSLLLLLFLPVLPRPSSSSSSSLIFKTYLNVNCHWAPPGDKATYNSRKIDNLQPSAQTRVEAHHSTAWLFPPPFFRCEFRSWSWWFLSLLCFPKCRISVLLYSYIYAEACVYLYIVCGFCNIKFFVVR